MTITVVLMLTAIYTWSFYFPAASSRNHISAPSDVSIKPGTVVLVPFHTIASFETYRLSQKADIKEIREGFCE
jgi:hypothetical protein